MTDAAKSDGQVVDDILKVHRVPFWVCEKIAAAVVANARERIRAETVEEVVSKLTIENTNQWGYTDASVIRQIRALAAAPPGFRCVPVEPTQAQYDAVWQGLQQDHFKRVKQVLSFDELRKLYQEFHKGMLAESGE